MPAHKKTTTASVAKKSTNINPWFFSTILLAGIIIGYITGVLAPSGFGDLWKPKYALTLPTADRYEGLAQSVNMAGDYQLGSPTAPVAITEYSDFQCPFCARFFETAMSEIKTNYIKTGKAVLTYRDFPLEFHAGAKLAAEAAKCAGEQGAFWRYHDALFLNQNFWGDNKEIRDIFIDLAKQLGIKKNQFTACLDEHKTLAAVEAGSAEGMKLGVSGTPTVFVNDEQIVGAQPYQVFAEAIEKALNPNSEKTNSATE